MRLSQTTLRLNTELLRASSVLVFILYLLETLKEGYVSFFFNPAWALLIFLTSGVFWLFDRGE